MAFDCIYVSVGTCVYITVLNGCATLNYCVSNILYIYAKAQVNSNVCVSMKASLYNA